MLTLSYTFDIAVQELAAVRSRHEAAVRRHGSPIRRVRHPRRDVQHGTMEIAIVSPEL